jgi:uncharacterized membrane protein
VSVGRALRVSLGDLYHQAWRLLVLNTLLALVVLGVVFATIAVRPAIVLAVLAGPIAVTLMYCVVTLAQTEDLRLTDAVTGLKQLWRRGFALGATVLVVAVLGLTAVPFWAQFGRWGWPLAALTIYLLAFFAVVQLALWPLAAYDATRPLADIARAAVAEVTRRPLGFAGLAAALLVVNLVGVAAAVMPFITLTIAYSFLVAAHFALPKSPLREV